MSLVLRYLIIGVTLYASAIYANTVMEAVKTYGFPAYGLGFAAIWALGYWLSEPDERREFYAELNALVATRPIVSVRKRTEPNHKAIDSRPA